MTIALSAHPALAPLVGQLAAVLPIKGLYYPARRNSDTDLPFFSNLSAMLQATSPRVCAFLSPYADLHSDVHTCLQSGVAVLCAGPVPKAELPIATGGIHRGSPLFAKALQQRRDPSFAEPVYLRLVAGVQEPGLLPAWWAICRQLAFASDLLGETPAQVHLCANRHGRAYQVALTATAPSGASIQASRRSPVGTCRTDPARPRRRNLSQCRTQRNHPSQHQGNPRRTRRCNSPGRTSVVARFFGKRGCAERALRRQRTGPAQRPAASAEDAPAGFGQTLMTNRAAADLRDSVQGVPSAACMGSLALIGLHAFVVYVLPEIAPDNWAFLKRSWGFHFWTFYPGYVALALYAVAATAAVPRVNQMAAKYGQRRGAVLIEVHAKPAPLVRPALHPILGGFLSWPTEIRIARGRVLARLGRRCRKHRLRRYWIPAHAAATMARHL